MENRKLRGKIAEAQLTQRQLAKRIGMSVNTLTGKLNGSRPFKVGEVSAICDVLNIHDAEEIADIFLLRPSQKWDEVRPDNADSPVEAGERGA